jgi:hypothetical protein
MKNNWILVEIGTGCILGFWIILEIFSGSSRFEDLALGTETSSYQALDERGEPAHLQKIRQPDLSQFLAAWSHRGNKPVILILGNSQSHSINQYKQGEANFVELVNHWMSNEPVDVVCHSLPNAGLQEFYLAFRFWQKRIPVKTLVVPLFMDDMREDGIRDVFFAALVKDKFQLADTSQQLSAEINSNLRTYWSKNTNTKVSGEKESEMAALHETLQERTEVFFDDYLDKHSQAWRNRPNVRGEFFNWLYRARNSLFGIKANTVRKMIPHRYNKNMNALRLLLQSCNESGVKVLLYIPPIRSDVPLPYDMKAYEAFKREVQSIAMEYPGSMVYKDFEDIVPGKYWGYKAATDLSSEREVDFMHFQFEGHKILADSLQATIIKLEKLR